MAEKTSDGAEKASKKEENENRENGGNIGHRSLPGWPLPNKMKILRF